MFAHSCVLIVCNKFILFLQAVSVILEMGIPSLMEQLMMFLVILCRWFLPRGRIDRNSLSQLLIMYSAISADILDFSEIFNQEKIKTSGSFKYVVLGVWSWSLVQFTIVITTSFHFRRHQQHQQRESTVQQIAAETKEDRSEILSIMLALFMQDGPFLLVRCYSIKVLHVIDYLIIFFSLKNFLTLILGLYRLLVLCGCIGKEGDDLLRKSEIARSMEILDDIDLDTVAVLSQKKGKQKRKHKIKEKY